MQMVAKADVTYIALTKLDEYFMLHLGRPPVLPVFPLR